MNLRRTIALLLLGVQGGCYTGPRSVQYSPRQYLSAHNPKKLWLTLNDGRKEIMVAPRVISDTLFGWNESGEQDLTIPIAEVKEIQARRLSVVRTALIPIATVLTGVVVIAGVTNTRGIADFSPSECEDLECDP